MLDQTKATVVAGRQGMVQYRFESKAKADALVDWLKKQVQLQPMGIQKASARIEEI